MVKIETKKRKKVLRIYMFVALGFNVHAINFFFDNKHAINIKLTSNTNNIS